MIKILVFSFGNATMALAIEHVEVVAVLVSNELDVTVIKSKWKQVKRSSAWRAPR